MYVNMYVNILRRCSANNLTRLGDFKTFDCSIISCVFRGGVLRYWKYATEYYTISIYIVYIDSIPYIYYVFRICYDMPICSTQYEKTKIFLNFY